MRGQARRSIVRIGLVSAIALTGGLTFAAEAAANGKLDADQAIAIGYMLDSPRPLAVITKGLSIAEALRRRYGIDTGHPVADREAAARRAQSELLDNASFSAEQIDAMARSLGFSLDPAACAATCDNVRRLSTLELQKRLLERFAFGDERPETPASPQTVVKSN